jgi:hypothetical protein
MDLVIARTDAGLHSDGQVITFIGDAQGGFAQTASVGLPGVVLGPDSLSLADFDGDGAIDATVSGWDHYSTGQVDEPFGNILSGQGNGAFVRLPGPLQFTRLQHVRDIDGDGRLDLVLAAGLGGADRAKVYFNKSAIGTTPASGDHDSHRQSDVADLVDELELIA